MVFIVCSKLHSLEDVHLSNKLSIYWTFLSDVRRLF